MHLGQVCGALVLRRPSLGEDSERLEGGRRHWRAGALGEALELRWHLHGDLLTLPATLGGVVNRVFAVPIGVQYDEGGRSRPWHVVRVQEHPELSARLGQLIGMDHGPRTQVRQARSRGQETRPRTRDRHAPAWVAHLAVGGSGTDRADRLAGVQHLPGLRETPVARCSLRPELGLIVLRSKPRVEPIGLLDCHRIHARRNL
mmetsp:Transcript_6444/g.11179  ORF Transcript_6444/g.11179 Transcript_6444/m.11179 type:complete len:202 (-) Transcript_6444:1233-1838(-)